MRAASALTVVTLMTLASVSKSEEMDKVTFAALINAAGAQCGVRIPDRSTEFEVAYREIRAAQAELFAAAEWAPEYPGRLASAEMIFKRERIENLETLCRTVLIDTAQEAER